MNVATAPVVVDDHLLLRILLSDEPDGLRPHGGRIVTTGLWYHRLCRALVSPSVTGALSRRLGAVDTSVAEATIQAVITLPDSIGLVSLREVAWPMARLVESGARLNLMSLEALAVAELTDGLLCLAMSDRNPQLVDAASARGRPVRLVDDG